MPQHPTRTSSPLSQKERERRRTQLEAQYERGELSERELEAALRSLTTQPVIRERA